MRKKFAAFAVVLALLFTTACYTERCVLELEQSDTSCQRQQENVYDIFFNSDIATETFMESALESALSAFDIIEKITVTHEESTIITVALVDYDDRFYTIEVFRSDSNEFHHVNSLNLGRWETWESHPRNLRIIDSHDRGDMDIVIRSRIPGSESLVLDDSWDTMFLGNPFRGYHYMPVRTSVTEFTNANGSTWIASIVVVDEYFSYRIEIYDSEFRNIQNIDFEVENIRMFSPISWLSGLTSLDLNNDGYMDIWKQDSTLNAQVGARYLIYKGYIWDIESQKFVEVEFVGFDWLMWPSYQDGYVINYIRDFVNAESVIQTLTWDGNRLIKVSEERH